MHKQNLLSFLRIGIFPIYFLACSPIAFAEDFPAAMVPSALGRSSADPVAWIAVPSNTDVYHAFPKDAVYRGSTLWVCNANSDGKLRKCKVIAAIPANDLRYVEAAKRLIPLFKLDKLSSQRVNIEKRQVSVRITLTRPGALPLPKDECSPPFCVPVRPLQK